MEKWFLSAKRGDFKEIGEQFSIDQVVARIIRNRDIIEIQDIEKYLNGTLKDCYSPYLLKDMEEGISLVAKTIKKKGKIRIIGDYDIDGVMSTYILLTGLNEITKNLDFKIPHRIHDGYGINIDIVEQAYKDQVDLLITCDNGISAINQIKRAKELGMKVIITDHHEVPYEEKDGKIEYFVPEADAVINPKQVGCSYPFKGICGAVVAFKFISGVLECFGKNEGIEKLLEFAAFATIGDVMDLVDENRIIVKEGLKRLRNTKNIGLRSLIEVNNLVSQQIQPYHIGFVLGPCMNASGRLETAKLSLELLLEEDEKKAKTMASDLKELNESRKELTQKGLEEAISILEASHLGHDKVIVVYLEDCHESLAGIIAGRIKERYQKPVFVVTQKAEKEASDELKGSGRSIEAYSMYEEMIKCKELFVKFGGHPMAAGFSIKRQHLGELRKELNKNTTLLEEDFIEKVSIDVPMPLSYVTENLIEQFQVLEPFGKGNPKPIFAQKNVQVGEVRLLGKNSNVAKIRLIDENGEQFQGVYFKEAKEFASYVKDNPIISITYYPEINEYNGKRSIQFIICNYK